MENIDCVKIYLTYSNAQCGKAYVILATVKRHIIQLKTSHRTAGTETTTSVVITTKKISYHIKISNGIAIPHKMKLNTSLILP